VSPSGISSIATRVYTNHHDTLDTRRSRRSTKCAAKSHAAAVTGLLPGFPASEGRIGLITGNIRSGVIGSPAIESNLRCTGDHLARLRWYQIESPHKGDLQPIDFDQDDRLLPQTRVPSEEIAGLVERVTFFNPESGFAVLSVNVRGQRDPVTSSAHCRP
jgi:hypothetical protein